ncbi:MAG: alpha-amylase family glycosyl hydrolase [Verrucomicrobiota bacterium]
MATDSPAQSNAFWRTQSIYQIITDRFYDGDPSNDNAEGTYAPSNPTGVHGGDFQGIEQKLDYIKALGATAIWISPIVLNTEGQYHGYSAWNFYQVAPHWGSLSNLQHMVQTAHARGLLVIDDIVVNHAGDLITGSGSGYPNFNYPTGYPLNYVNSSKTYPAPFNLTATNPSLTNIFHNYGGIDNFDVSNQVVLGWLDGLNDFRTETPYVRTKMAAIYQYWIQQAGFDGFRVDTALEVDMGCWQSFCPAIHSYAATNGNTNFFMFAEADNGSDTEEGSYTGTEGGGAFKFDSIVDYPLYYNAINSVFATTTGATSVIEDHYDAIAADYDPASWMQLVTFLDNHDNPRFLSTSATNNNTNRLEVALAFLYTARGIPCLYYGTEQGFDGATDPDDREDMFAGEFKDGPAGTVLQLSSPGVDNFNMTHPLFLWVAQLNNFRRLYPALTLGSHVNQWNNPNGPGLFAYSRVLNTQEVFVVFNSASTSQTLPSRTSTYPTGTVLVNLLNTNETITLGSGSQTPAITVPSTSAEIFIAQSQWQPLEPVVAGNSPVHYATNVSTLSPIVLQFSEPMNTNSVQAAFSTVPPVSGTFAWSAAGDTVTFTPNGAGFPPLTNITVVVSNSAFDAVSGNTMFASYSLLFQTAAAPPSVYISSPATDGMVIPIGSNTTYLIQVCFTPALDTNNPAFFNLTINGVLQPQPSCIFRPPGVVAGCGGLRSLLYNWSGALPGSNTIQVVYSNNAAVLSDTRTVIVPPPLAISGLAGNNQSIVWSSTPGVNYIVLATTNLSLPFTPISGVLPANGLSTSYLDISNSPPVPQKFYEIEVVP